MLHILKKALRNQKSTFKRICSTNHLSLSYDINSQYIDILHDIFVAREYADYFPFYEKNTIIDIGAHVGYFTLFAALNTHKNSQIFSIEPSLTNYKILNQNISDCGCTNIQTLNTAIGNENKEVPFYEGKSVNNSVMKDYALLGDDKITSTVKMITLENFLSDYNIEKVDFLKMDCEGSEYDIVAQTNPAIFAKIKTISMEFHDLKKENFTANYLINNLEKYGFKVVKFYYCPTNQNLNYGKLIVSK